MKKLFLIISATMIMYSCDTGTQQQNDEQDTTGVENQGTSMNTNMQEEVNEEEFVTTAASSSMMEVELGQIAVQKGSNEEIKTFGQMMVQDHSKANEQLKAALEGTNITVPESMQQEHQQKVDSLKNVSAEQFDQAYMDMMVQVHQQDVSKFENAQGQLQNEQLNSWVENTLPILKQHLQKAEEINNNLQGNTTAQK